MFESHVYDLLGMCVGHLYYVLGMFWGCWGVFEGCLGGVLEVFWDMFWDNTTHFGQELLQPSPMFLCIS